MENAQNDLHWMKKAISQAKKAAKQDEVPVGCVIVKNGKCIATEHNKKEKRQNAMLHAEVVALNKASRRLGRWRMTDCSLYVTLEPCPMCMGAIINARVGRVIFGAYDPKAGACGSLYNLNEGKLNHTVDLTAGVMQAECGAVLTDYFKGKRKK